MANSPLPLLIGAAAAFLFLSKKGGGTESVPNIILLEKLEDFDISDAQIAEYEEKYDAASLIAAVIPGVSANQLATATVGIAKENPKTLFFVFSAESLVTLEGTSGALTVKVTRFTHKDATGSHLFTKVTPEMVSEKVPAGYNFAIKDLDKNLLGNAGGTGQRGLAGSAKSTANATVRGSRGSRGPRGPRGLASSAPASNLVSENWFQRLRASVNI